MKDKDARARLAREALGRWCEALVACGDPEISARAVSPACVVERWPPGEHPESPPEEVIEGIAAINAWLSKSPEGWRFDVSEAPIDVLAPGPPTIVEATYVVSKDWFHNRGLWRAHIGADGLLLRLEHRPRNIPPEMLLPPSDWDPENAQ